MEEVYQILKDKLNEMHKDNMTNVLVDYADIAKFYPMVCFMMQIKKIANGWD